MAILTVDQLRDHISSELEAEALQRLLDASEEAIVARAGTPGSRTELVFGGHRFITLGRPATSVSAITETVGTTETTLDATDYLAHPGGYLLERLQGGTHSRWYWRGRIAVTYTAVDDTSTREEVQIALIKAALDEHPGVASERIGEWEERFAVSSAAWNGTEERESILSRLDNGVGMLVVGGPGW